MPNARDEPPGIAERFARLPDLLAVPAIPWCDVALALDVPVSTLDKLRAQGKGPRAFPIGRRLHVRPADLHRWIDELAEAATADEREATR